MSVDEVDAIKVFAYAHQLNAEFVARVQHAIDEALKHGGEERERRKQQSVSVAAVATGAQNPRGEGKPEADVETESEVELDEEAGNESMSSSPHHSLQQSHILTVAQNMCQLRSCPTVQSSSTSEPRRTSRPTDSKQESKVEEPFQSNPDRGNLQLNFSSEVIQQTLDVLAKRTRERSGLRYVLDNMFNEDTCDEADRVQLKNIYMDELRSHLYEQPSDRKLCDAMARSNHLPPGFPWGLPVEEDEHGDIPASEAAETLVIPHLDEWLRTGQIIPGKNMLTNRWVEAFMSDASLMGRKMSDPIKFLRQKRSFVLARNDLLLNFLQQFAKEVKEEKTTFEDLTNMVDLMAFIRRDDERTHKFIETVSGFGTGQTFRRLHGDPQFSFTWFAAVKSAVKRILTTWVTQGWLLPWKFLPSDDPQLLEALMKDSNQVWTLIRRSRRRQTYAKKTMAQRLKEALSPD